MPKEQKPATRFNRWAKARFELDEQDGSEINATVSQMVSLSFWFCSYNSLSSLRGRPE